MQSVGSGSGAILRQRCDSDAPDCVFCGRRAPTLPIRVPGSLHPSSPSFSVVSRFTADFATYNPGNKYFEVYSPLISTLYGQVFWTVMDPVPLPAEVVAQFKGKTMAITGYGPVFDDS